MYQYVDLKGVSFMKVLNLKQYRENAKLSQRDISELLDVSQPHYCRWKSGNTFPNARQIRLLCDILKCTPNDLFGIHGDYEIAMEKISRKE